MVVQHNMAALNAYRYFNINNNMIAKSLEKLVSGYAINRAADNPAGLAISEKMRSQIAGLDQSVRNAQDGISMFQTYEGALDETHKILQKMKILASRAANGTYDNDVDRTSIQIEFDQLNKELNQIADTDFNGIVMLNGGKMSDGRTALANGKISYKSSSPTSTTAPNSGAAGDVSVSNAFSGASANLTYKNSIVLQLGPRSKDAVNFTFDYSKYSNLIGSLNADINVMAEGLGTDKLSLLSQAEANYAIDQIDFAINKTSLVRATFGAINNRLEHKVDNMNTTSANLTEAESRIRDTDIAKEMMTFARYQILAQVSQAMMAQAMKLSQGLLSMLQ